MYPASPTVSSNDIPVMIQKLKSANLSSSQADIVYSFETFYGKKGFLTEKQYQLLQKFAAEFSQEKLDADAVWRSNFTDEMRNHFNIICSYYKTTGYFTSIVREWEKDNTYIPSEQQYQKICQNTYAKKLIEAHKSPTIFDNGDLVSLRSTFSTNSMRLPAEGGKIQRGYPKAPLFIIDNKVLRDDLYRYCKVFSMIDPEYVVLIREKDLKKYKPGK